MSLSLDCYDLQAVRLLDKQQLTSQLTHVSLDCHGITAEATAGLAQQLAGLANLAHLVLSRLPHELPGGLPSQLGKLTHLHISYVCECAAEQLQHLSCFTALRQLSLDSNVTAGHLTALQHLSQLTGLDITNRPVLHAQSAFRFNVNSTQGWACLSGLQRLALGRCAVQPKALEALTQLQALSLVDVDIRRSTTATDPLLLVAVSKLSLLTALHLRPEECHTSLSPAAFTALTASTNLVSLQLHWRPTCSNIATDCWVFFRPGSVHPHLHMIDIHCEAVSAQLLNKEQLQVMCSCCPALDSLQLEVCLEDCPTALEPLPQLSALTSLDLDLGRLWLSTVDAALARFVGVASQLTGLKHLVLPGLPQQSKPALLQLTALTSLQKLALKCGMDWPIVIHSRVSCALGYQRSLKTA